MKTWGRRIRAAIGMGLTWGAVWFGAGILLARLPGISSDFPLALLFAPLGFVTGILFSAILVGIEGRRGFDRTSLPRFAAWGATGGLLLSALFARAVSFGWGDLLVIAPTFALASAVCASGSLAVARRAVSRALPDVRRNAGEAEVTDPEKRKLL